MRDYLGSNAVAIIAPAGYGKTEEIVIAVKESEGRQLILTHTRAGVAALKERLQKYSVSKDKYEVATIASFCLKWCKAYPHRACINQEELNNINIDYQKIYQGAKSVFLFQWAQKVLSESYQAIFVDEYQDCVQSQHELFLAIENIIKLRIFGDPLQGIFYWIKNDHIVDWKTITFPIVYPLQDPWRWKKTNPTFGEMVSEIRKILYPAVDGTDVELNLNNVNGCLSIINSTVWDNGKYAYRIKGYKSIVYITTIEQKQNSFSQHGGGYFQSDEKKDISDIKRKLIEVDLLGGNKKALAWIEIVKSCVTGVTKELGSYIGNLEKGKTNFDRISKHKELGQIIKKIVETGDNEAILFFLRYFWKEDEFKVYRKEFLYRVGSIYQFIVEEKISLCDAIELLENSNHRMERKHTFSRLSSRTVLTKGLEFECVIVDVRDKMDARDFYVAVTRAKKYVYIITDKNKLHFKGII